MKRHICLCMILSLLCMLFQPTLYAIDLANATTENPFAVNIRNGYLKVTGIPEKSEYNNWVILLQKKTGGVTYRGEILKRSKTNSIVMKMPSTLPVGDYYINMYYSVATDKEFGMSTFI